MGRPSHGISEMSQSKQHLQLHREALQRRTQQDWANREYVQLMSSSITRIADFLNAFSKSCSGRLSYLDARLTSLERKVTFLEAKVGVSEDTFSSEKILNKNGLNDNDAQRRVSDESEDESYLESQRFP